MANAAKPNKRRVEGGGRVTPKGGPTSKKKPTPKKKVPSGGDAPDASSRYTPPVPNAYVESPRWVPILMFALFGLGMLMIVLHYMGVLLPSADSNWWLAAGLGSILAGIITATQLR